jgi:hypothetical protein
MPPIWSRNVLWPRKRLMVRTTSALLASMPITSSRPTSSSLGRYRMCGERPAPRRGPMTMMLITNSNKMAGSRGTMAWGTCGKLNSTWPERSRKSSQASGMSSRTASLRSRALRRASRVRATSASLPARPGERMVERELFSTDGFTGAVGAPAVGNAALAS